MFAVNCFTPRKLKLSGEGIVAGEFQGRKWGTRSPGERRRFVPGLPLNKWAMESGKSAAHMV